MPSYNIRYRDRKNGQIQTISLEAGSTQNARDIASRMGIVLNVKRKAGFSLNNGLSADERIIFLRRLSTMLGSKMGSSESLRLIRDSFSGSISKASSGLLVRIERGMDLAPAMTDMGEAFFPESTVALVRAGSQGGESWKALRDAADFEFQMASIRKGSGKGIWSAAFGFILGAILILATQFYVAPKMMDSDMMKMAADSGSLDIGWVLVMTEVLSWFMGVALVMMIFFGILSYVAKPLIPVIADRIILKVPFYRDLMLAKNNYTVLYGLSMLIGSGLRIEEALNLSMEAAPKGELKEDVNRALTAVRTGLPWAAAMQTLHPTDRAALGTSQDREQIAKTLDIMSEQYRDLYAQRIGSFVPTLQMLSAIFMTLGSVVLFGMVMLPMLQMSEGLLKGL